ncbi:uridine kinase-like protein 3 isoform X3 [Fagus crenata]
MFCILTALSCSFEQLRHQLVDQSSLIDICYASSKPFRCYTGSADADVRLARRIRWDTVEKSRDIGTVLEVVEHGLGHLPFTENQVITPTEKLPKDISERHVLLLDPILGTGNWAVQAISLLLRKGVPECNIIFLNLISAPQGVHVVCKSFPRIKIVTSEIDSGLNKDFCVIPRMGEFGDQYLGMDDDDHQVMAPSQ